MMKRTIRVAYRRRACFLQDLVVDMLQVVILVFRFKFFEKLPRKSFLIDGTASPVGVDRDWEQTEI